MLERLSSSVYARIQPLVDPIVPVDSNRGYIICDEFIVVIDTTYFLNHLSEELKYLRKLTELKVKYVINTHYHEDHSLGNGIFKCEVIAHAESLRLMKEVRNQQFAEALEQIKDPTTRKQLGELAPGYPTITFEESYRIDSHPSIEVIHLGGHTPDLSVVYVPTEKIIFASDNLFGSRDPSTPSHPYMTIRSDLGNWRAALRRMIDMDVRVAVPGHFGVCNEQAIRKAAEYLESFTNKVRELKLEGYSKEEVKRRPELLELPSLSCETWVQHNVESQSTWFELQGRNC